MCLIMVIIFDGQGHKNCLVPSKNLGHSSYRFHIWTLFGKHVFHHVIPFRSWILILCSDLFPHGQDHEKEVDNRTVELEMLRERRSAVHTELQELEEKRAVEAEDYKAGICCGLFGSRLA